MLGAVQQLVFKQIKEQLKSDSVSIHYDPTKCLPYHCDPYSYELETIFSHRSDNDREKPRYHVSIQNTITSRKTLCTIE